MNWNRLAREIVLIAGMALGCNNIEPPVELQPQADGGSATPPVAMTTTMRVSVTTTGTFGDQGARVALWQQASPAVDAAQCQWLGSTAASVGQLHQFDCGDVEEQPDYGVFLDRLGVTVENLVAAAEAPAGSHELTVVRLVVAVVRSTGEAEEELGSVACDLDEQLGRAAGAAALPNRLRVGLGAGACAVLARDRYLNTVWMTIGGGPRSQFHKYVYAGQAPGGRSFVGAFSEETHVELDFVTPSVPDATAPISLSLVNVPQDSCYDEWQLAAISLRTGVGTLDLDPGLVMGCTGGPQDATDIICATEGPTLVCAPGNMCFR